MRVPPKLPAILLAALLGLAGCSAPVAAQRGTSPAAGFADLVEQVLPSVVNIATQQTVDANQAIAELPPELRGTPFERQLRERFRGRREQITGQGSGFVIDPAGFIVTNAHVVGNASAVRVTFADGTSYPARLVGADDATDIALLKIEAPRPLPALRFGRANNTRVGDWIVAVGNPYGLGGTVTAGILSARGRDIGAGPFDDFLQTDAPINPGNSGGPLFNLAGEVIGVNTAIYSPVGASVGIGFASPAELVAPVVGELRANGRIARGWLGVSAEPLTPQQAREASSGVRIAGLTANGPAARAGLRVGDVITAVNGTAVDSPRALARTVAQSPPGSTARLSVLRQGRRQEIGVPLGTRPANPQG
jgi:serine protease Do